MKTRDQQAADLADSLLGGPRSIAVVGEPGSGRSHFLGQIYDHLRSADDDFWPPRDEHWVGFPTRLEPRVDARPTFLWLAAPCADANGLPMPAVRLGQQLDAYATDATAVRHER